MKKLLSILGAVGITATGTNNIVSCYGGKTKTVKQPLTSVVESTPQKNEINNLTTDKTKLQQDLQNKQSTIDALTGEKSRKMKYFNELNNIIQKIKTELLNKIKILESKNKHLEQKQSNLKEEIQKITQEIEQLNNQVGNTGSEAVELSYQKQIKIAENKKNNIILELITKQLDENKKEIQQLKMQQNQEKFYISEINSISSPTKIIVPITQQNKNKIYVLEKDIKKIVLNQVKEKVNNNLTEQDFIIEFESKDINHNGTVDIELSHPKTIKIKIHGKNNLVGETNWISISLPAATVA